jgi:thiol-disulfide isomerase/thioredoxin
VRPPVETILAPPFARDLEWVNVAPLRMDRQRGRPVLVEFWDLCGPSSLRTLPYMKAWHERYAPSGLRVIAVHCPGFPFAGDPATARAAVARLGIEHAVCLDPDFVVWRTYDNPGWPARYLFDGEGRLRDFHHGEGGYRETELAVQGLLGVAREPLPALRPEDEPDARIVVPTPDRPGLYRGPYIAGAVWAVLEGDGEAAVGDRLIAVDAPGAHQLVEHPVSTEGFLDVRLSGALSCHATCFTPGLAPPPDEWDDRGDPDLEV